MEKRIGPSFKKTKALIYKKDSNGFYVYAKPNLCDTQTVVKYISRYLGRPVIALSRIDSYDGENVTFHYNRHEDNVFVKKCSLERLAKKGIVEVLNDTPKSIVRETTFRN